MNSKTKSLKHFVKLILSKRVSFFFLGGKDKKEDFKSWKAFKVEIITKVVTFKTMMIEIRNNFYFEINDELSEEIKYFMPLFFNCFDGHFLFMFFFGKAFIMHYNTFCVFFSTYIKSLMM